MGKVIGIDLGTTNSVVAVMENGQPTIIANAEGQRTTPSVVAFTKSEEVLVGDTARRQAVTNPENTVYSAKRFMGCTFKERADEAQRMPYKVVKGENGAVAFDIRGKKFSPQEISAKILQKLKASAEDYLGETVTEAVITVPAYFNDSQRQATKDAGKIAGLDVKRIVNEPTAAALAYGMDKKKDEKIVVFDFGGGTFDVSILEVGADVVQVLATGGDNHLGGDNIDEALIDFLAKTFKDESGIDVSKDPMAMQRLKDGAEKAKKELSSAQSTEINLPFLSADQTGGKHLVVSITRAKFEQLIGEIVNKTLQPCKNVLKDAGLSTSDINEVILVGGSTRIPLVQQKVKDLFNKEPNKTVNPDEVVGLGAAVQGGVLAGDVKDVLLLDVSPLSLGIETLGGVMTKIIERNTTIPTEKKQIFSTAADNQTSTDIRVLQGERQMAADNRELARFSLVDIPPAPRGVPQIEVKFDIDANGIVSVSAKDLGTNKEQKITVQAPTKLSDEEIEQMVKDAESNAEEDKTKREKVEAKNTLDTMIFTIEKTLKDSGDKLDAALRTDLEASLKKAKDGLETADTEELNALKEELEKHSHKIAEELYKTTQQPGADGQQASPDAAEPKADEPDVVDAEFEDKK